jgi:hypothetical protein
MNYFNKNKQLAGRFCTLVLTFFVVLNCSNSYAQTKDSLWEVYGERNVDPSIKLYRHKTEQKIRAEFHLGQQDTIIVREYNETANEFPPNTIILSNRSNFLFIQFLNDSTWYIFGNRVEFAFYPYIFRTTNAGISWEPLVQTWPEQSNITKMSSLFRMYDVTHGIWVIGLESNKLKYRITEDGGYTWEYKQIRLKRLYKRIGMHTHIQMSTTNNSTTIFLNNTTVFRNGNRYVSKNFGQKFRKVN